MGATIRPFQRLAALFRPRRPSPALGAFALPPEIVLIIAAYLTYTSTTSLALTCRTLCSLCFPGHTRPSTAEKEELLLLLEKDIPNLYFCHYCVELHRWNQHWGKRCGQLLFMDVEEDLPCKQHLSRDFVRLPHTCHIPYHHARLVMNRHFYGPAHGLPLQKFKDRSSVYWRSSGITDSESLLSRIVDDKLVVLAVKTLYHSRGDSKRLREFIESQGHAACRHLTLATGLPHGAPVQLPELAKNKTAPQYFAPCHLSLRSCTFCLTDYCIEISWRGERKGHVVKVSSYRLLGNCRSPFDWVWRSMVTFGAVHEPRMAYPGMVIDTWNKADGIEAETQAEWVEIPRRALPRSLD